MFVRVNCGCEWRARSAEHSAVEHQSTSATNIPPRGRDGDLEWTPRLRSTGHWQAIDGQRLCARCANGCRWARMSWRSFCPAFVCPLSPAPSAVSAGTAGEVDHERINDNCKFTFLPVGIMQNECQDHSQIYDTIVLTERCDVRAD